MGVIAGRSDVKQQNSGKNILKVKSFSKIVKRYEKALKVDI